MSDIMQRIRQAQAGDMASKNALVQENNGLIWSVARRFQGRGAELDDLYQLGCLGFLKAVDGFDTAYGTQFSTYAVPKIAGEIRRFLRDDGTVKVSRSIKERAVQIRTYRSRLMTALGREPSISEIAVQTGFTVEEIIQAETVTSTAESIQSESGEEGFSLENILTDTESEERMVEKIALRQAVSDLPDRERQVISLRYFHGLTQQQTAKLMQISQVQVSRIEKKAITILHQRLL